MASNPISSVPLAFLTDKPAAQKIYYCCNNCHQNSNYYQGTSSGSGSSLASSSSKFGNPVPIFGRSTPSRQYSFSDNPETPCATCSRPMTRILTYVARPAKKLDEPNQGAGFVKGVVTYMIMDDLVVEPLSTISGITFLNKYNIKDLASLQAKEVDMGMNEALKLLKASLHTTNVSTTVFLNAEPFAFEVD